MTWLNYLSVIGIILMVIISHQIGKGKLKLFSKNHLDDRVKSDNTTFISLEQP